MKLLLIRHGQTPGNVLGQLDTEHPGPGLTELGERQAEAMARSLANEPIGALYASTLVRTQITAAPLGRVHSLEVEVLEGLHEIEAGSLEKLTDQESHKRYMGTVFSWAAGDHEFAARHVLANTGIVALEGDPDRGWKLLHWDGSPVGGLALADPTAEDPTGQDTARA